MFSQISSGNEKIAEQQKVDHGSVFLNKLASKHPINESKAEEIKKHGVLNRE